MNKRRVNYVQKPYKAVEGAGKLAWRGYAAFTDFLSKIGYPEEAGAALNENSNKTFGDKKIVIVIDCYPGVYQDEIIGGFQKLHPSLVISGDACAWEPEEMDRALKEDLTEDPVFGSMTSSTLTDFFQEEKLCRCRERIREQKRGWILVCGVGASLITRGDVLLYADMPRWEIELRYRRGMANWRTTLTDVPVSEKFKRGYFAEWRWADRHKQAILRDMDYFLDTSREKDPCFVEADVLRRALEETLCGPFRLTPYFDPGVWGGHWMKRKFGLKENGSNYAWSFDGVLEENSLSYLFGDVPIEIPAMDLVLLEPVKLLGKKVYQQFGAEFPIRFDLLDTIGGQNLSLQVHPQLSYIRENFHMPYTQDESYYILDTEKEEAYVYLGVKEGAEKAMEEALWKAERGGESFAAENYVNRFSVKKHDHVLIPAGTVHASGAGTMVLEISATPYIFTFKLWDWGRNGLDGKPRPLHIDHGIKNICWDRDETWVRENLLHQEKMIYEDENVCIEQTGLHELEFIDTFRFTVYREARIKTEGTVHVLNLVEGEEAMIVSDDQSFAPFPVHFAETFILPAFVKSYKIVAEKEEIDIGEKIAIKAEVAIEEETAVKRENAVQKEDITNRKTSPIRLIMARVR